MSQRSEVEASGASQSAELRYPEMQRLKDDAVRPFLALPAFVALRAECLAAIRSANRGQVFARARVQGAALFSLGARHAREQQGDDRPLYWNRLQTLYELASTASGVLADEALAASVMHVFEYAARGVRDEPVEQAAQDRLARVVLVGFDPFRFERGVDISNPSGASVLALHGETIAVRGACARLRGCVFPVRFRDFDAGCVEHYLGNELRDPQLRMLVTISQNNSSVSALERWAVGVRTTSAHDNAGQFGHPAHPDTSIDGTYDLREQDGSTPWRALHLESTLPIDAMLQANLEADRVEAGNTRTDTRGSGGNYLSNEIFYRTRRLELRTLESRGRAIPMGHLHLWLLPPPADMSSQAQFCARRAEIVRHTRAILQEAIAVVCS